MKFHCCFCGQMMETASAYALILQKMAQNSQEASPSQTFVFETFIKECYLCGFFSLIFRYGMLLMLGMTAGGLVTGQFLLSEVLFSTAFIVIVIGGLSKLFEMMFGIPYPKFLNNKKKQKLGDLAVFLIGLLAGFGMVA